MAKPKQNPIPCAPEKKKRKKKNQSAPEIDPLTEDDWVVVKKQRVTILIPPLPTKVQSPIPNVINRQPRENPAKAKSQSPTKTNSQLQLGVSALNLSGHEPEKFMSLSPEQTVPPTELVHHVVPNSTSQEPTSLSHRVASGDSPLQSFGVEKGLGVNDATNMSKQRTMIFVGTDAFLDRRMRASYLEKKLEKAGGLENWLFSLGLSCFTKVFRKKRVHKFHLANLTMKKLKDMGVYAVGPRRKLLHAIDCLCEPHCFQNV